MNDDDKTPTDSKDSVKGEAEVEEEYTQCSFIEEAAAKAKCEKSLNDYETPEDSKDKDYNSQCFYIKDKEAKAKCESSL